MTRSTMPSTDVVARTVRLLVRVFSMNCGCTVICDAGSTPVSSPTSSSTSPCEM